MKISRSKRFIAVILALFMILTSVPLTASASSYQVTGTKELFNYNKFENSALKDSVDSSYSLSDYHWQTGTWNSDSFYIKDGYMYGDVNPLIRNSNYNKDWTMEYKFRVDEQVANSSIITLGTATTNVDSSDIMFLTQNGQLWIGDVAVASSLCNISTGTTHTFAIRYNNGALNLILDGTSIYNATLNAANQAKFEAIGHVSLGIINNTTSTSSAGTTYPGNGNAGAHQTYVYSLKATGYTKDEISADYETTNVVTIEPTVYVHGTYSDSVEDTVDMEYDYMMLGSRIADASVPGEYSTPVSSTKAISKILVLESGAELSIENGKLTGDMGSVYSTVGTGTSDASATLFFLFTDNSCELHKVAVKTNPVAQHVVGFGFNWYNPFASTRRSMTAYELLAVGSVGMNASEGTYLQSGDSPKSQNSGAANFPKMYSPYNSIWDAYDGGSSKALVDGLTERRLSVDKLAGYYAAVGWNSSASRELYITSAPANYYLDISKDYDGSNGITHTAGTRTYTLQLLAGNLYYSYTEGSSKTTTITKNVISGSTNLSIGSTDAAISASGAFSQGKDTKGYVNIAGKNASGGQTYQAQYVMAYDAVSSSTPTNNVVQITMPIKVNVADKSTVRPYYVEFNGEGKDSRCYTAEAWEAYRNALINSEYFLGNYENVSSDEGNALAVELDNAHTALAENINPDYTVHVNTEKVVAPTCTEQGYTVYTCERCGYEQQADYTPATGHSYVYTSNRDGSTHTITCAVGDLDASTANCIDENSDNICDLCNQQLYTPANFAAYDQAKAELENAMATNQYTAASLNEAKAALEAMTYFTYTADQKAVTPDSQQDAIDAEAAAIVSVQNSLVKADTSVYDALMKTVDTLNADAYNIEVVKAAKESAVTTETVTIAGVNYTGYSYDTAITAITTAMNTNQYEYTVAVYDFNGDVYYLTADGSYVAGDWDDDGDPVAPASAGRFHYGDYVTAANPVDASAACTWSCEVIAKYTNTLSSTKYMCNDTAYQFNVRGDTSLYTSAGAASGSCKVTFINGVTNSVVYSEYVAKNTTYTLSAVPLPTLPFYTVTNYTNAATGATVAKTSRPKITANTTYIINYAVESAAYTINLKDANGAVVEGYPVTTEYNKLITFDVPGAVAFVDTDTDTVLAYGSTYSFYACQNLNVQAVASVDEDVYVSVARPIISNGIATFIGSYAAPSNANVESYGIVMDVAGNTENLSLADVDANNYVYNLSASRVTCGNQFVINVPLNNSAGAQVKYVAYTIYTIDDVKYISYSPIIDATLE